MLETIFLILAGVGILTILIGRHIMIRDTGGDLPFLWIIALRLIPFSDLAYMVRHFSQAKRGGIISIIGMWLIVPHLSRELWQTEERVKTMFHQFEQNMARGAANTAEAEQKLMEQMPAEIVSAWVERKKLLQTAREKKVAELQNRIAGWHAQIQAMRASLNVNDEAAVKTFNEQAAAYSRLNALAKKETDIMLAARSGKPGA